MLLGSGSWQLALGGSLIGGSSLFQNKGGKKSQLAKVFQAGCQPQIINRFAGRKSSLPIKIVIAPNIFLLPEERFHIYIVLDQPQRIRIWCNSKGCYHR